MFDKKTFSEILQKISNSYNSITDFSDKSEVNRTYLSKYINMKLSNPPTPKILEKIANNSNGVISYAQLMEVCGYIDVSIDIESEQIKQRTEYILDNSDYLSSIGLTKQQIFELQNIMNMNLSSDEYVNSLDNFLLELPLEISYSILKFLQDMLLNLRIKDEEQLRLAKSLHREVEDLIDNAHSIKELNNIKQEYSKKSQYYMVPVYGQISAGQPNWAEENIEGRLPFDTNLMNILNPEEYFFLRVNGESMNKVIKNGAFALIHKQDIVDDGEIAVVLVNGYNATLKKFTKQGDFIILEPDSDDSTIKSQVYDKTTNIKILGKYVGKMEFNK
ncbi:MAG: hypothetical protein IJH39_01145 [Clostridia bacterium]|nr:hypothetical protein [Clostridia bacterium]